MNNIYKIIRSLLFPLFLLSLAIYLGNVGCKQLAPYDSAEPPKFKYTCITPKEECDKKSMALSIGLVSSPYSPGSQTDCYNDFFGNDMKDFNKDGLGANDSVYCGEANWVINDISLDDIKGAHWLGLPHSDNDKSDDAYIQFKVLNDTDGLYIAYDSRAKDKPDWLDAAFVRSRKSQTEYHYIEITKTFADEKVKLDLYKFAVLPKEDQKIELSGNLSGGVTWPADMKGEDSAMYMVIIKPQEEDDCSQPEEREPTVYDGDHISLEEAKKAAKEKCEEEVLKPGKNKEQCGEPVCDKVPAAESETVNSILSGLTVGPVSFEVSSEIEFNPVLYPSEATVSIAGHTYTRNVTGKLYFEYVLDNFKHLMTMKVNSMVLEIDPIDTAIGNFTDIKVALLAPVPAECKDSNPLYARPCNLYQIANQQDPSDPTTNKIFVASISAKKGNDPFLYVGKNANVLDINIDNTKRSFIIAGGPLTTQVKVDGEDHELSVGINLTGHFLNFAPKALGTESHRLAECAFRRFDSNQPGLIGYSANKDDILLDGSVSFEVYGDPIPNSAYHWYEDYGLVTEREFLPPERQKVIKKGQMSFGVHDISLVIRDDHGISDVDTFEVTVRDTQPPELQIPSDVLALPHGPGPVQVNLGQAWAYDTCSLDVMVTNDAPQDSKFFPGVTPVIWTADDGRGQTASKTQHVKVFDLEPWSVLDLRNRMSELEKILQQISESVSKSATAAQACGAADRCVVSMSGLSDTVDQAGTLLTNTILPEEARELQNAAVNKLRQVSGVLTESEELIRRSAASPDLRRQLRGRAAETAQSTISRLQEAASMIRRLQETL